MQPVNLANFQRYEEQFLIGRRVQNRSHFLFEYVMVQKRELVGSTWVTELTTPINPSIDDDATEGEEKRGGPPTIPFSN